MPTDRAGKVRSGFQFFCCVRVFPLYHFLRCCTPAVFLYFFPFFPFGVVINSRVSSRIVLVHVCLSLPCPYSISLVGALNELCLSGRVKGCGSL